MEKKSLYIVAVIVLVVGLVLSFSGFTGQSVLGKCKDTDGGDAPEIPGTVSYEKSDLIYKDECYTWGNVGEKKYVRERYCLDKMRNREYHCFNGCLENVEGEGYCASGGYDI